MKIRYFIDPQTGAPYIEHHGVSESEVEAVLRAPGEDRPGREGSCVAIGRTLAGRILRVIYVPDPEPDSVFVITAYPLQGQASTSVPATPPEETAMTKKQTNFPPGWDESRVQRVLAHYESQSQDEAVAEDEAAFESPTETTMEVPSELVSKVRELIAKNKKSA